MSTITVVKKDGFVAIAADTLTKCGSVKESAAFVVNHQKILHVGENYLAFAGSASVELALRDYFANAPQSAALGCVEEIYRTWLAVHQALKDRYFLNPEEEKHASVESSQTDVLIANPRGIFGVAWDRSVQEFSRYYAYGYGNELALGAMFAAYELKGRSADDVARLGVEAAAAFDDSTGLPVISFAVALSEAG